MMHGENSGASGNQLQQKEFKKIRNICKTQRKRNNWTIAMIESDKIVEILILWCEKCIRHTMAMSSCSSNIINAGVFKHQI